MKLQITHVIQDEGHRVLFGGVRMAGQDKGKVVSFHIRRPNADSIIAELNKSQITKLPVYGEF